MIGWWFIAGASLAATPSTVEVLRATSYMDKHALCELIADADACAAVAGRDPAEDRRVACAGLARLMVTRTGFSDVFTANDGEQLFMTDASKVLKGACAEQPDAVEGLDALVDHANLWSVEGYAVAATAVGGHAAQACAAWAEAVTSWPADVEADLAYRVRLGNVVACKDVATIRAVFGDALETSPTASAFLGEVLRASGDKEGACEAFRRAVATDPQAHAANLFDTAQRGVEMTCASGGEAAGQ